MKFIINTDNPTWGHILKIKGEYKGDLNYEYIDSYGEAQKALFTDLIQKEKWKELQLSDFFKREILPQYNPYIKKFLEQMK